MSLGYVPSAGGLVFDHTNRVLLIQRDPVSFNIPKGHIEPGESAEYAAMREMREETGYQVDIVRHLGVIGRRSVEASGEEVDKRIDMFLVLITGGELGSDEEEPVWVPYEHAITHMFHPEEAMFLQAHPPGTK